ncbi:MAG: hypothetical protein Kow0097_13370 [Candidatus Bipolaricaulota bacterium]
MRSVKRPGCTSRPARRDGVEAAVELFNACAQRMFVRNQPIMNEVRTEWGTPGLGLESATQVVFHGDRLVGYVEFLNPTAPDVRPMFSGQVHPTYQGPWSRERARELGKGANPTLRLENWPGTPRPSRRRNEDDEPEKRQPNDVHRGPVSRTAPSLGKRAGRRRLRYRTITVRETVCAGGTASHGRR